MGARVAALDWSATPLGPLAGWPLSLRSAVGLMLRSPVAMVLLWGPDGTMIYNDAYARFAGGRHPGLLGMAVLEAWPEAVELNTQVMQVGLAGGQLQFKDYALTLYRDGGVGEELFLDLDYSPVPDDSGRPGGVIAIVSDITTRVRAQRWQASESERLRAMFEHAPIFSALVRGPTHRFEFANPAYYRLVGRRPLLGLPVSEAIPEVVEQGFLAMLDTVLASGEPQTGLAAPVRLRRGAGDALEERRVDFLMQPLRDADGTVGGIIMQGTDVTDRVATERALRESEARYRSFAQVMPNQVWTATPDGGLDWVNERALAELDATAEELSGEGWASRIHPDDLPRTGERWMASVQAGSRYEAQFRMRVGGDWRWYIARAAPIRNEAGEITRWVGTSTDIDDQKRAEAALDALNARLGEEVAARTADRDRMWRLSSELMAVLAEDTVIRSANPAWTRILGWSEQELAGRRWLEFIHPDDVPAAQAEAGRLFQGRPMQGFECRLQGRGGAWHVIAWSATAEDGLLHALGRDVTADRAAQRALEESQAALQQAQKMETVGKLTGGVAHDFNNLLQVISGNLELLSETAADAAQRRLVSQAMDAVGRGARLASQLLSYARRQPLAPKVVNVGRLIRNMDDMLRRTLGETIEVETVIAGGLWNCMVDPVQIETALINLAINARDAMPAGGKLTIEAGNAALDDAYVQQHAELRRGQYVMLAVTDTGTGMDAAVIEQAFEPFFSTKPEGKGTGLGLSMVYGFVKQSGGHVTIYSELGHGTTVKLYLPRSSHHEAPEVRRAPGAVVGGGETILVAEDDPEVLATVMAMLSGLGYRVLTARDAASALVVIESGAAVDLLFTDVVMPGPLRSPELAQRVRERSPHLPVLFTSGYTDNAIVHGGRLDEGVELLSKPYSRQALALKVREMLDAAARLRRPLAAHRVLLVEDDPIIRMGSVSLLKRLGHVVVSAAHAEQALQLVEKEPNFDVLFTDIGLPGMRGDALAARVRAVLPDIAVVFATGYNDAPALDGRTAVVTKPFGRAEVERALGEVLG